MRIISWLVIAGLLGTTLLAKIASADGGVLNQPSGAYQTFKKVVDVLDPQVEELYDLNSKEWRHGLSASLWKFTSNEIYLASARLGYSFDQEPLDDEHKLIYAGLKLDVPGIVTRLTPDTLEAKVGSVGLLKTTASLLGKYAAVGGFLGRDVSADENAYGISVGGRVTW